MEKKILDFIKKKLGKKKFTLFLNNKNLLKNGMIDSMDVAEIIFFVEKIKKKKININKVFGKYFEFNFKNIQKLF